ncbi:response regulator [bacterium]|nr:response regulator [bacterium]NIO19021.1 response regulator [bacterium]NIO74150.1 response regulator [bacterium]
MEKKVLRILVIDDEEGVLTLLKFRLGKFGHEVITANNGPEGIRKARMLEPDLILLDLVMPGMSGFRVCELLKGYKKTKDIPIFIFTALDRLEDVERAFEKGADDYIVKPFEVVTINNTIENKFSMFVEKVAYKQDFRERPKEIPEE